MTEAEARDTNADIEDVTNNLSEAGAIVTSQITQPILRAAQRFRVLNSSACADLGRLIVLLDRHRLVALWASAKPNPISAPATWSSKVIRALLIAAASIAILTTLGIVLSLVFNTIEFFRLYPASEFFFGTSWAPSFSGRGGASDLGILPLLWGTFYISIVALLVAVPIGLFAAIYLVGIRQRQRAVHCQAAARSPRRYSDHRLRPVRAADRRAPSDA